MTGRVSIPEEERQYNAASCFSELSLDEKE